MMRLMGGATVVAVGVMLAPVGVQAQTPALVNARVEITAAEAGWSRTLEAIERQANALDRARQQEIAALQVKLTEAEARGAAEVARLQVELIAAREALVTDLASRDTAYAEEIAVFRRAVTDIASTPEGAAALARYNSGDRVGALAILDRIAAAENMADQLAAERVQVQANLRQAARLRSNAILALDARDKGTPTVDTGAVIDRYEEVVRLDPGEYADRYELAELYAAAGRRDEALTAAERMEALATNDRDRSVALDFKAVLLMSQGDRDGALEIHRRSLEIFERLSAADPASVNLARDVAVALTRIGDVLASQGDRDGALENYSRVLETLLRLFAADPASRDLPRDISDSLDRIGDVLMSQRDRAGALSRYQLSLEIRERLSAADPASANLAQGVSLSLMRIGSVLVDTGDPDGALGLYRRSLEIMERLSAADPASVGLAQSVSGTLARIGNVLLSQGELNGALELYRRSHEIDERLSEADPASLDLARNMSISLSKIGDILLSQGDRDGALGLYRRSLEIIERLYAADPASADLARYVVVSCLKIAGITGERRYGERALAILRDLEVRGTLAEADRPVIAQLEEILAGLGAPGAPGG